MAMKQSRNSKTKRIVLFFQAQIGKCPGVEWVDEQQRLFRIPWVHNNNRDWKEEHSQIFLEWAKHTNKYFDGDQTDYPKWKTQIRCALNKMKEDIQPVKNLHKLDGPNPYRVYQFVDNDLGGASPSPQRSPFTDEGSTSDSCGVSSTGSPYPYHSPNHQTYAENMFPVTPSPPQPSATAVNFDHQDYNQDYLLTTATTPQPQYNNLSHPKFLTPNIPSTVLEVQNEVNNATNNEVNDQNFNINAASDNDHVYESMETGSLPSDLKEVRDLVPPGQNIPNPDDLGSIPSMNTPNASLEHQNRSNEQYVNLQTLQTMNPTMSSQPENNSANTATFMTLNDCMSSENVANLPEFCFSLWYGFNKKLPIEQEMDIPIEGISFYTDPANIKQCVTFTDQSYQAAVFGPLKACQYNMPYLAENILDPTQTKLIGQLLDNMLRGISFTVTNGDLYAQRLCKTRVFVTDLKTRSALLQRGAEEPARILDTHQSEEPEPVYLTFGQEITKGHQEPLRRVLLCMKIEHLITKRKIAAREADGPTDSMNPLFSNNDETDNQLEEVKEQFQGINIQQ